METKLLQQIYQKYYREIYFYVYSLCNSYSLAEDITQETFLKAILSLSAGHSNMRAWLYKVARNLCFNEMGKGKRQVEFQKEAEGVDLEEPLVKLIKEERYRQLYKALRKLNEKKRELLILQYFGGLSQKEIGAILHMTPENVRVTAMRAKRELRKLMEVEDNDIS